MTNKPLKSKKYPYVSIIIGEKLFSIRVIQYVLNIYSTEIFNTDDLMLLLFNNLNVHFENNHCIPKNLLHSFFAN